MFWRASRVKRGSLILLAVVGLVIIYLVEMTLHRVKQPYFDQKLAAAKLARRAQEAIKYAIAQRHIAIDRVSDPNETGLIGEEFTLITTDQGDLEAKLTTTDPNWAGVVVDMLKSVGVDSGDYVAVAWTGSMPAMNIAVLAAIETIGAIPVIISSIGASMWGANNPDFAWLDMEKYLYDRGIFHYRSVAASIGGRGDRGANISPEGRRLCRQIAQRNGVPLIETDNLDDAIKMRMKIYKEHLPPGKKYAAYINVGGGVASVGSAHDVGGIRPGITKHLPRGNYPSRGAMIRFGYLGVPIIDISDIKYLAKKYGMPIAPEPIPEPPAGGVFFKNQYRTEIILVLLILYAALTFVVIRIDIKAYFRRKTS